MNFSVFVRTKEQLEIVKKYPIDKIYTNNLELVLKEKDLYYEVPKYYKKENLPKNLLINDIGLLQEKEKNIITDYGMNVANESTLKLLSSYHVEKITLSLEMNLEELKFFSNLKDYPIEIYVYGKPKVMTLKNHPVFKEGNYELEDMKKSRYQVEVDKNNIVYIYQKEPINQLENILRYQEMGIQNFRIDFYEETKEQIKGILKKIFKKEKM